MFVDLVLWSGDLTDLLTSRATYLNTTLACIYGVPAPPGATATTFVRAMLPVAERSGLDERGSTRSACHLRSIDDASVPRDTTMVGRDIATFGMIGLGSR